MTTTKYADVNAVSLIVRLFLPLCFNPNPFFPALHEKSHPVPRSLRGSPRKVYSSPTVSRLVTVSMFEPQSHQLLLSFCVSLPCQRSLGPELKLTHSPALHHHHLLHPRERFLWAMKKLINRLSQWSMSHCLAHLQPVNSSPWTGCSQFVPRGGPGLY